MKQLISSPKMIEKKEILVYKGEPLYLETYQDGEVCLNSALGSFRCLEDFKAEIDRLENVIELGKLL